MTELSEELDKILVSTKRYNMGLDPITEVDFTPEDHYVIYPELKVARDKILALIKQARIHELKEILPKEVIEKVQRIKVICEKDHVLWSENSYDRDYEGKVEETKNYGERNPFCSKCGSPTKVVQSTEDWTTMKNIDILEVEEKIAKLEARGSKGSTE